ncbi:MAG: methionine--tRNA ligase [Rhizobiaceae bacterium]|nr:methionine--tRNA ligase [Rhizobiaceae bacterium]
MAQEKFYLTSAIAYPNGKPHIGHAYEFVCCDAIARFKRLDGFDTRFLLGTDVHGQKMLQTARDLGITPKELADQNSDVFQEMTDKLNVSYDRFIRTSDEDHHASCQALWKKMEANGDIYKDTYSGWYSVRDEAYYDESETTLDEENVRIGPQGTPVEWVDEESYFFRLSAYEDKLLALYEEQGDFIGPKSRKNEIVSFVKGGLNDLSISRTTFDWGVKVPGDEKHVMYVWVDALTNYITGAGYPDESSDLWSYWPAGIHIIGKDITRFHAVYWPAFLMSAGVELPQRVFGHGFLLNKGEKMSKSLGNVVDPFEMADLYGVDQLRFFFLRNVRFGFDGSYSHEEIVNQTNADLPNNFGNLAQRSLSMIAKNCEGRVPSRGVATPEDTALLNKLYALPDACRKHMDDYAIHDYVDAIWQVLTDANGYIDNQAPWGLKKTDPERMGTVLWTIAEVVRVCAILAQPVMPTSCNRLLDLLSVEENSREFSNASPVDALVSGVELPKPEGVFPRFVEPKYE